MFLRRNHLIRFCALGALLWCVGNLSCAQTVPSGEQLQQLLAPIALYPDPLLAQITAASADPQQIVDADAWLKQNSNLQGQALMDAAQKQGFDPAFISLVTFPTVLDAMARNIDDYAAIGAAFKADPAAVTAAIQSLRQQAYASGALDSNEYQNVSVQQQDGAPVVIVQPANPQVVYVPQYQPEVVFAGAPGIITAPLITFGTGIAIGYLLTNQPWGWHGWGWGWGGRGVIWQNNVWRYNYRYRSPHPYYRPRPPIYNRPIYARPPPNWNQRPGYRPSPGFRPPPTRPPSPGYRPPNQGRPPSPNYRPPNQGRPPNPDNRPPGQRPGEGRPPGNNVGRPPGGARPDVRPPNTGGARPPPRNPYAGFPQGGNRPQPQRPPPATVGSRPSGFGGNNNGNAARAASDRGRASSGAKPPPKGRSQ
jgi:Protein of unknown function (DUF3300)